MINVRYFVRSISDILDDQCQIFWMINLRYGNLLYPHLVPWLYPLAQVTSPAKVHKKLASYATNHPNTIGKKFFVLATGVFLTYVPMFQINFRSCA